MPRRGRGARGGGGAPPAPEGGEGTAGGGGAGAEIARLFATIGLDTSGFLGGLDALDAAGQQAASRQSQYATAVEQAWERGRAAGGRFAGASQDVPTVRAMLRGGSTFDDALRALQQMGRSRSDIATFRQAIESNLGSVAATAQRTSAGLNGIVSATAAVASTTSRLRTPISTEMGEYTAAVRAAQQQTTTGGAGQTAASVAGALAFNRATRTPAPEPTPGRVKPRFQTTGNAFVDFDRAHAALATAREAELRQLIAQLRAEAGSSLPPPRQPRAAGPAAAGASDARQGGGLLGLLGLGSPRQVARGALAFLGIGSIAGVGVTLLERAHRLIQDTITSEERLARTAQATNAVYGRRVATQLRSQAQRFVDNPATRGSAEDYGTALLAVRPLTTEYGLQSTQLDRLITSAGTLARIHGTELGPAVAALKGVISGSTNAAEAFGVSITDTSGRIKGANASYSELAELFGRTRAAQIALAAVQRETDQQQANTATAVDTTATALDRLGKFADTAKTKLTDLAAKPFEVVVTTVANVLTGIPAPSTAAPGPPTTGAVRRPIPRPEPTPNPTPSTPVPDQQLEGAQVGLLEFGHWFADQLTNLGLIGPEHRPTPADRAAVQPPATPPAPAPRVSETNPATGQPWNFAPTIGAPPPVVQQATSATERLTTAFESLVEQAHHVAGVLGDVGQRASQWATIGRALEGPHFPLTLGRATPEQVGAARAAQEREDENAQRVAIGTGARMRDQLVAAIEVAKEIGPNAIAQAEKALADFDRSAALHTAQVTAQHAAAVTSLVSDEAHSRVAQLDLQLQAQQLTRAHELSQIKIQELDVDERRAPLLLKQADLQDRITVASRSNLDVEKQLLDARLAGLGASERLQNVNYRLRLNQAEGAKFTADVLRGRPVDTTLPRRLLEDQANAYLDQIDAEYEDLKAQGPVLSATQAQTRDELTRQRDLLDLEGQRRDIEDDLLPLQRRSRELQSQTDAIQRQLDRLKEQQEPARTVAEQATIVAEQAKLAAESTERWSTAALAGATGLISAADAAERLQRALPGGQVSGRLEAGLGAGGLGPSRTTPGAEGGAGGGPPDVSGDVHRGELLVVESARQHGLSLEETRVLLSNVRAEGGLTGRLGDAGHSAGPLQFYGPGGQLDAFARDMGLTLDQAKEYARTHIKESIDWALTHYWGAGLRQGEQAGLRGADLAAWQQGPGAQVSKYPERAREAYNQLSDAQIEQLLSENETTIVALGPQAKQDVQDAVSAGLNEQGRAAGGPVEAGRTYLVGERGPEIFRPSVTGLIEPHPVARDAPAPGHPLAPATPAPLRLTPAPAAPLSSAPIRVVVATPAPTLAPAARSGRLLASASPLPTPSLRVVAPSPVVVPTARPLVVVRIPPAPLADPRVTADVRLAIPGSPRAGRNRRNPAVSPGAWRTRQDAAPEQSIRVDAGATGPITVNVRAPAPSPTALPRLVVAAPAPAVARAALPPVVPRETAIHGELEENGRFSRFLPERGLEENARIIRFLPEETERFFRFVPERGRELEEQTGRISRFDPEETGKIYRFLPERGGRGDTPRETTRETLRELRESHQPAIRVVPSTVRERIERSSAVLHTRTERVPAFQAGTTFAPGGAALVGEAGPEVVFLPRGSTVVPNAEIANADFGHGDSDRLRNPPATTTRRMDVARDDWYRDGSGDPPTTNEIRAYIVEAATKRGIDPEVALRVAQHEGFATGEAAQRGTFETGSSWWPFQLHYGGRGYEQFGTVAGLGNDFTAKTGWQPGDPRAWKDSIDFALDTAVIRGWYPTFYGSLPAGVKKWEGLPHLAAGVSNFRGGRAIVGERGPEVVVAARAASGSERLGSSRTPTAAVRPIRVAVADTPTPGRRPDPPAALPGRESGGTVVTHHAYLVGERGREVFVPATPGVILPRVQPPAPLVVPAPSGHPAPLPSGLAVQSSVDVTINGPINNTADIERVARQAADDASRKMGDETYFRVRGQLLRVFRGASPGVNTSLVGSSR